VAERIQLVSTMLAHRGEYGVVTALSAAARTTALTQAQRAADGLRYLSGELRSLLAVVVLVRGRVRTAAQRQADLGALLPEAEHQQSKYLSNGIEANHGPFKQRVRPMRGFKRAASAVVFARGHDPESAQRADVQPPEAVG
jgi:transposase-like protein